MRKAGIREIETRISDSCFPAFLIGLGVLVGFQGFLYTLQTVGLGAGILGALGSFAVLRRQSLLGDGVSHAALPGIALAFLLTLSKAPLVLICGAAAAGWLGALAVLAIVRATRIKSDTALGVVLGVFFGIG